VTGSQGKTIKFHAGYKEFEIMPTKDGKSALEVREALHVWPRPGGTLFLALPNHDNTNTCTLFNESAGPEHIQNLNDDGVIGMFKSKFPDLLSLIGPEKILESHHAHPFSHLYSVDTPTWHYKGEVVLLGDAAHGVLPYYGLGINAGFEGCRHVINLMALHPSKNGWGPDWLTVFAEFNKYKSATDVLREAAVENALELHEHVGDQHFLFRKEVERELQRRFPHNFIESHAIMSFTNIPMDACGRIMKIEGEVTKALCKGKTKLTEIDWVEAEKLVKTRLNEDITNIKPWYEPALPQAKM